MLHRYGLSFAETIAHALRFEDQAGALISMNSRAIPQESTLILAHEMIWSLMREFLDAGLLRLPAGM